MIRVLIFILSVIFVAGAVTFFASMSERIEAEAFGLKYDIHAGAAIAAMFISALLLIFTTAWFKDLAALPGKLRAREKEARRARGVAALTRGLEAVAVGDAADAQHHARVAHRNLDDSALTRLLTAQAAEVAGDEKTAGENFAAMLEAPETEFLGLRGLYLRAMRAGDKGAARGYAERAFKLRANAKWAFESVFELGLERGAWGETRNALEIALKNKIVPADKAKRGEAALLTADAYSASLSGEKSLALQEAEAALRLAPHFAPAATLAAELHNAQGKRQRAVKILENAFAEAPHPALLRAHDALFASEKPEKRAEMMNKIAARRPAAREAKLHLAERHTLRGEFEDAIVILEPLLMEKATARESAAMAEAIAGARGTEAAKPWLEQAAKAPRDPTPGADGAFNFTRDGWARLVREYMEHARLAPPPIEDAPRGLSMDEIKGLAPPAPRVETALIEATPVEQAEDVAEEVTADAAAETGDEKVPGDARDQAPAPGARSPDAAQESAGEGDRANAAAKGGDGDDGSAAVRKPDAAPGEGPDAAGPPESEIGEKPNAETNSEPDNDSSKDDPEEKDRPAETAARKAV